MYSENCAPGCERQKLLQGKWSQEGNVLGLTCLKSSPQCLWKSRVILLYRVFKYRAFRLFFYWLVKLKLVGIAANRLKGRGRGRVEQISLKGAWAEAVWLTDVVTHPLITQLDSLAYLLLVEMLHHHGDVFIQQISEHVEGNSYCASGQGWVDT